MNDFLLTLPSCKDYSFAQVLNTLPRAEYTAPDSRGFFTSIVFNGRVVGNDTILAKAGKVASRLLAVLKYSVTLSTRVQFNKTKRRPIMADNTQDASASSNSISSTIPQELIVIIDGRGIDINEYRGSRAMLEDEGLIPEGFKWSKKYADAFWEEGSLKYWLRRKRPEGVKGSRKQFENVDWFCLRFSLINYPSFSQIKIARKAKELKELIYRNSPQGIAEEESCLARYLKAQKDKQFQAFKARIPGLIPVKCVRKAGVKSQSTDAGGTGVADSTY